MDFRGRQMRETLTRLRYRYWPDHLLGEILSKKWTETAIPVILLLIVGFALSRSLEHFLSPSSLADTARQAGEIGFIGLGMGLVVIVGGIDLSVGSMFALTDFCALYLLDVLGWPVSAVIVATLICGALLGAVNGVLIGYLRLRAFITTLITLIIYRSTYDLLLFSNSTKIAAAFPDFPSWNFIGGGDVLEAQGEAVLLEGGVGDAEARVAGQEGLAGLRVDQAARLADADIAQVLDGEALRGVDRLRVAAAELGVLIERVVQRSIVVGATEALARGEAEARDTVGLELE